MTMTSSPDIRTWQSVSPRLIAVAAAVGEADAAVAECGCALKSAFMQHFLLALAVAPELRISDPVPVDATRFEFVPLFSED